LYLCKELITLTNTIKHLETELESSHQNKEHVIKRKKAVVIALNNLFKCRHNKQPNAAELNCLKRTLNRCYPMGVMY